MPNKKVVKVTGTELEAVARRRNELMTSKFRLSFQAHRLFLYVLSMVADDHDEDTEYEFSVNELANSIGIDRSNLYKSMVDILEELAATMINVQVIGQDGKPVKNRFIRVGLIKNRQEIRVAEAGQSFVVGSVSVSVYKELLPYVRELKERYTETDLKYVFRLSSSYSQKLYDLLKSRAFINRPWRVDRSELMELLAIEDGKFKLFGDFRRFVLERARDEINAYTDLALDLEYVNTGRTVTEVIFKMRKEGGHDVALLPGTVKQSVFNGMLQLGLDTKSAEQVMVDWWQSDPERVRWHVNEAKRMRSLGKVKNAVGWLVAGLRNDYRPQRSLLSEMRKKVDSKRAAYENSGGLQLQDDGLQATLKKLYQNFTADRPAPSDQSGDHVV